MTRTSDVATAHCLALDERAAADATRPVTRVDDRATAITAPPRSGPSAASGARYGESAAAARAAAHYDQIMVPSRTSRAPGRSAFASSSGNRPPSLRSCSTVRSSGSSWQRRPDHS